MADTYWNNVTDPPPGFTLMGSDTVLVRRPGPENQGRGEVYELTWQAIVDALVAAGQRRDAPRV